MGCAQSRCTCRPPAHAGAGEGRGAGGSCAGASSTASLGCLCSPRFAGAFTLRQRMLNFVQNIQYYMMFEVMEPTWHTLEKNLKSVSSNVTAVTLTLQQPGPSHCKVLREEGARVGVRVMPPARPHSEPHGEKPHLCTHAVLPHVTGWLVWRGGSAPTHPVAPRLSC